MCNRRLSERLWITFFSLLPHSTPYAIPSWHQRGNFQTQDQAQANMKGEQKPPERRMEGKGQDETSRSWFKIIVSALAKWTQSAGGGEQRELCWTHIEMLGTSLRRGEGNRSFYY